MSFEQPGSYQYTALDLNPPPGAPEGFPVQYTSPTGFTSFYLPPYARQDVDYGLVQGIGVKMRRLTTWVDEDGNVQKWNDDWERRYPAWDCSWAGLFEALEQKELDLFKYRFQIDEGIGTPPKNRYLGIPEQVLPLPDQVPDEMMAWAREMADKYRPVDPDSIEREDKPPGNATIVPAMAFNSVKPYVIDGDWGAIGDKVTIRLPELCPSDYEEREALVNDDIYIPDRKSLYARTEKAVGFEYRTQLLGAGPGILGTRDRGHSVRNVSIANLWFIHLFDDQLPVFHFWHVPKGRRQPLIARSIYEPKIKDPVNKPGQVQRRARVANRPSRFSPVPGRGRGVQKRKSPTKIKIKSKTKGKTKTALDRRPLLSPSPPRSPSPSFSFVASPPGSYEPPSPPSPLSAPYTPTLFDRARQGIVRTFRGTRKGKKAGVRLDTTFQPSLTTDLSSHPMVTRHRAGHDYASTASPATPRRPKTKKQQPIPAKKSSAPATAARSTGVQKNRKRTTNKSWISCSFPTVVALEEAVAAVTAAADVLDVAAAAIVHPKLEPEQDYESEEALETPSHGYNLRGRR